MASEKKVIDSNVVEVASADDSSRVSDPLRAVTSRQLSIGGVAKEFTAEQKSYILKKLDYDHLVSYDDLPVTASYLLEKIQHLQVLDAVKILEDFVAEHEDDVNIKTKDFEFIEKLLASAPGSVSFVQGDGPDVEKDNSRQLVSEVEWHDSEYGPYDVFDWELQVKTEAGVIEFHSPYAEVRGVTEPYDNPDMYCETIRIYIAGIIWTAIGSFINEFFKQRRP
ncbi:hypothetical protein OY671_007458, partial [Metschnikowia pulcherrima]